MDLVTDRSQIHHGLVTDFGHGLVTDLVMYHLVTRVMDLATDLDGFGDGFITDLVIDLSRICHGLFTELQKATKYNARGSWQRSGN